MMKQSEPRVTADFFWPLELMASIPYKHPMRLIHSIHCRHTIYRACAILFTLVWFGCSPNSSPRPSDQVSQVKPEDIVLRLLVVDDAPLATQLEREWNARSGAAVKLLQVTTEEFLEAAKTRRLRADVVVYPAGLLGELVERDLIIPIGDEKLDDPAFNLRDVFSLVRDQEATWNKRTYAASLGSPVFVLYYRRDLFAEHGIEPPLDWASYQRAVDTLTTVARTSVEGKEPVEWHATCEPLAAGWSGQVLLARAAAYARHRSSYSTLFNFATLEPLINRPSYVRALQELVIATKSNQEFCRQATPEAVRSAFYEGRCAMALTWPSATAQMPKDSPVPSTDIGVVHLPGAFEVYNFRDSKWEKRSGNEPEHVPLLGIAGRMGSATKESRHQTEAVGMVLWLTGPELGVTISPASPYTTVFRHSQLPNVANWLEPRSDKSLASQYAQTCESTQRSATWLVSPNVPGRHEYLHALDEAVNQALVGQASAADALEAAAQKWRQISERLGLDAQRSAYERSLGISN